MNILMCMIIVPVIFVLIMLGLLVINEVVEDLKKINKMRKNNEWSNSTIRVMGYNYCNPNSRNNMWGVGIMILILSILILTALSTIALIAANKIDEDDLMEEIEKELKNQERGDKWWDVLYVEWLWRNMRRKHSITGVQIVILMYGLLRP